jgi:hypothetical protein
MRKIFVVAKKWVVKNNINVDDSNTEASSSGVSDGPSDLDSKDETPPVKPSSDEVSPARLSPTRPSPVRLSPARPSPARPSPAKPSAPAGASPARISNAPAKPPRTPQLRKDTYKWDNEIGQMVQTADRDGRSMQHVVSPPGTNVILNYSGRPTLRPTLPVKKPVPIAKRLGPHFIRPTLAPATRPTPE